MLIESHCNVFNIFSFFAASEFQKKRCCKKFEKNMASWLEWVNGVLFKFFHNFLEEITPYGPNYYLDSSCFVETVNFL